MKRKQAPKPALRSTLWLEDQNLASVRLSAIQVAAHLPEPEPYGGGMMSHSGTRPGKSAEKVVADAEKIVAFITKK